MYFVVFFVVCKYSSFAQKEISEIIKSKMERNEYYSEKDELFYNGEDGKHIYKW